MRSFLLVIVSSSVLLAACQSPDVGQDCLFGNALDPCQPGQTTGCTQTVPADYAATGVTTCENLVCVRSPVRANPYCSKPCVSNTDCSQSETGLVCRQLTFDQNFFNTLPPDVQAKYNKVLGSLGTSSYCATPQQ